jgi:hypothetical protein
MSGSPAESFAYGVWLCERAKSLIATRAFWLGVTALATALLDHDELNGSTCRRIIRCAVQLPFAGRQVDDTSHFPRSPEVKD